MYGFARLRKHNQTQRSSRRAGGRARKRRFRPRFEMLEARLAPAVITVNTLSDETNHTDSALSLREAIAVANSNSTAGLSAGELNQISGTLGDDTIAFDPALFSGGTGTITLTGGQLNITDTTAPTTITGPGAATLSISGNNASRVFKVLAGATATISGLTVSGGNVVSAFDSGGGILNAGALTVSGCVVSGNTAYLLGGGIHNTGVLRVSQSVLSTNASHDEAGGIGNLGTCTVVDSTIGNNTASFGGEIVSLGSFAVFTATGCAISDSGSSLAVDNGASFTATNCTFSASSSGGDGVQNNSSGTFVATDCTFSALVRAADNSGTFTATNCTFVGAPGAQNFGAFSATNCAFTGAAGVQNSAGSFRATNCNMSGNSGTGIGNFSPGTFTATNCTISGNASGGINDIFGTFTATNCTISGNTGGGINVTFGTLTATNCTISGNAGSGIDSFFGTITATNCTVSHNTASVGGGIFSGFSATRLLNTIVAGNTASTGPDISGSVTANYCLIQNASNWTPGAGSGNNITGVNPLLAALGSYGGATQTIALLPGSPAIDAGTSSGAPPKDQRGDGRLGNVDIGAFESQGFTMSLVSGDNQVTAPGTAFANPLVVQVTANNSVEPVAGGVVTYSGPSSGASTNPAVTTAVIGSNGQASDSVTANSTVGGYQVVASAAGSSNTVTFHLLNGASAPVVTVNGPSTDPEGTSVTFTGSFTDAGGTSAGPYSYTWHVVDSNGQSIPDQSGSVSAPGSVPSFSFAPNDEGTYTISLTVTDKFNVSGSQSAAMTATNVAPSNVTLTPSPATINEGDSTTLSGSFTDPGSGDTHTVDINWGDGSVDTTVNLGAGVLTFSGVSHQYLDNLPGDAPFIISATVTDDDGASAVGGTSVVVKNVAPGNVTLTPSASSIYESQSITLTGSFTDPGILDTHTVVINWGDGSANTTLTLAASVLTFNAGSHQYLENLPGNARYTITATVTDKDGANGTGSTTVVVTDAPLSATGQTVSATAGAPFSGIVATFTDADALAPLSDFSATIAWGDGNTSAGTVASDGHGGYTVAGSNTYEAPGTYAVIVTINDVGGSTATATGTANVASLGQYVHHGLTGGIGFWNSPNGQALINAFNGGPTSTALGNWLAATFNNIYGANAGSHNLAGKTNAQVAAFYQSLFNQTGPKLDAQVMSTALSVYATTLSLGGTAAQAYGFEVTTYGLGAYSYLVGADGAAFGVPNNTTLDVYQYLREANRRAVAGVLWNGDTAMRNLGNDLFSGINQAGTIG